MLFFFFQAEDGIRYKLVTGVQTCALPISGRRLVEPDLLVLDEPTTGVDLAAQESFAALLEELHGELGATILYVSHEFGAVERVVGRLLLVNARIAFDGEPSELPALWHDPSHVHP